MKKTILLLVNFCIIFSAYANPEKEYKKIIEQYDIADEAKAVPRNSPAEFLETALDNNKLLAKFIKDIQKNKGAEKEAIQKTAELPRFYPQYDPTIIADMQGFCDTLLANMGIAELGINCSLHVVQSEEINAYTALTENGFAMCLTSSLLTQRGISYNILMGYIAHEFAHGALMHHIRRFYANAKEYRKQRLLGNIAIAVNAAAAGAEAYAAAQGVQPSGTDYGAVVNDIEQEIKTSTHKYFFEYSREQEYEADLFAFRFLENFGCGEDFINGLRILGAQQYDSIYSEYDDHPTIQSRINFIKFVQQHPELGNKKK